jgi:hypothetical protein
LNSCKRWHFGWSEKMKPSLRYSWFTRYALLLVTASRGWCCYQLVLTNVQLYTCIKLDNHTKYTGTIRDLWEWATAAHGMNESPLRSRIYNLKTKTFIIYIITFVKILKHKYVAVLLTPYNDNSTFWHISIYIHILLYRILKWILYSVSIKLIIYIFHYKSLESVRQQ